MIKIYENAGVNINADVKEDTVNFKAKGILGPVVNPVVNLMMQYFKEERPLVLTDDQLIFSSWIPPMPSKAFDRLVNNQIKMAVTRRHIPEEVSVAVTGKCPCDCMFCCAKGIVAEPELTLDEMKDLIDQAIDAGAYLLVFDGGETLLRKDIYEIIEHVDDRAIAVMFTNGLYLTEEVAKKLKDAGLYSLQVSMDSPYQEDHDRVRGFPGIYEKATSGAKAAVEAGLLVSIYYVARPENSDEKTLNDLVKLAEDIGAHEVSIYDILAIGKWLEHEDETMSTGDRLRTVALHKRVNAPGMKGPKVMSFSYFEGPELYGCLAGRRWMHVTPAGDVTPCSYTPITFGNIREEPLIDIWKKIRSHPAYKKDGLPCMVQDKEFREKYIYTIPKDGRIPYPVSNYDTK